MSTSDLSSLSSAPSSDGELSFPTLKLKQGKLTTAAGDGSPTSSPKASPSQQAREASLPHQFVLADNSDIAFIVMFRSRFQDAFSKDVPSFGPQDIERGVAELEPSEDIEQLLCALLSLVLNRKKYVERGHYGRALEEAVLSQKSQWPKTWRSINPLHGGKSFNNMEPFERLTLLKTLIVWSLTTSEIVTHRLKESYKQTRHEDDLNQPLSVQPWGVDGRKRRYWLVEGQNDTTFRLYRESNPKLVHNTWWTVAGTIEELKNISDGLRTESSQAANRLADKIMAATPRFEQTEERRKRKEYRQSRRAQFIKSEPGFSLYEGRTRGKRMKYTFSEDEDEGSDAISTRRSIRQSARSTSAAPSGPTYTASGRQVRSRFGISYGDHNKPQEGKDSVKVSPERSKDLGTPKLHDGRPKRSGRAQVSDFKKRNHSADYDSIDGVDDEGEAASSEEEWAGDDNDIEGKLDEDDADEAMSDHGSKDSLLGEDRKLVVKLKYRKTAKHASNGIEAACNTNYKTPVDLPSNVPRNEDRTPARTAHVTSSGLPTQAPSGMDNFYTLQPVVHQANAPIANIPHLAYVHHSPHPQYLPAAQHLLPPSQSPPINFNFNSMPSSFPRSGHPPSSNGKASPNSFPSYFDQVEAAKRASYPPLAITRPAAQAGVYPSQNPAPQNPLFPPLQRPMISPQAHYPYQKASIQSHGYPSMANMSSSGQPAYYLPHNAAALAPEISLPQEMGIPPQSVYHGQPNGGGQKPSFPPTRNVDEQARAAGQPYSA